MSKPLFAIAGMAGGGGVYIFLGLSYAFAAVFGCVIVAQRGRKFAGLFLAALAFACAVVVVIKVIGGN